MKSLIFSIFSLLLICCCTTQVNAQSEVTDTLDATISIDYSIEKKGAKFIVVKTITNTAGEASIEKSKPLTTGEKTDYIIALKNKLEEDQKKLESEIPQYVKYILIARQDLRNKRTTRKLNNESLKKIEKL